MCKKKEHVREKVQSSVHEGSNDNDGSVCGSDSAFYKQSEGHSMAETLTVALRVAEEAIEEAIAKAEEFSDSLEKQNEARYLRDHKEELIEELATTIVQKIIQRRKRSEMQAEYDFVWPQPQTLIEPSELPSPSRPQGSLQGPPDPLKSSYSIWRSRSAFSLTSDDSPDKQPEDVGAGAGGGLQEHASLKREAKATSLPSWKSVDRLDNSKVLEAVGRNSAALITLQPLCLAAGSGPKDPLEDELRSRLSKLVLCANSKDSSSSEEEWPADKHMDKENDRQKEKTKPKDTERERQRKYSAASLCSITTEVLKVLNATEELIGEAVGENYTPSESLTSPTSSLSSETRRLDQRLTKMEENVYLAAGAVYGLEGALGDLEQCARSISSTTTDTDLAFLEDQVASAAAQVQQSELQPQTLDSSRHQRRKLPAPPLKDKLEPEQQVQVSQPQ
ncbi:unnamed protein product [Lampetra planeri]